MSLRIGSRAHRIVCFVVVFAASGPAWAQSESSVRGRVTAAVDGTPVAGATVTLQELPAGESIETMTDPSGAFVFPSVRPGAYALTGAHDGFARGEIRFVLEPRELRTVTLALDLRPFEVRLEVAAESTAGSTHSPSSTVLTSARFDTMPLSQQTNLPDAIVDVAPGLIRGHDDFIHIRGHEIALNPFINGVSFWENPHVVFSSSLSPDVIDTANVMTGGFPAEYGNRFGGVVDVVTKSGFNLQNRGAISVGAGQAGRGNVTGELGGHRGQFAYYTSGSMFQSDRFLSPPDRDALHDSGRGGHAFAQLEGNFGRLGALKVILMGDGANFEIPIARRDLEFRPLARPAQRTRQQTAIAGWTRAASTVAVSTSFYQRWSSARLRPAAGPLTVRAQLDRELLTLGAKADVTRFAGRHAFKAGIDAVRLRPDETLFYDYSGYTPFAHQLGLSHIHVIGGPITFAGRQAGGQISVYAQDGVRLGNRIMADLGVRLDRHDLVVAATHASPRVNLAFHTGSAVLHASYNHFFVPPPIEGVLSSSAGLTERIREIGRALPPLEPTTEDQFEVGGRAPIGPIGVSLTGYSRVTDNPFHTTVWPDSRVYSYASFDRERAYGLETKIDVPRLERYGVTGYLNYALGRVSFYNPVTGGFVTEAEHLSESSRFLAPMDQTHTLTSGLTYRHAASGLWFGTVMEYGSGTPIGHGEAGHTHAEGEGDHADETPGGPTRVPEHVTANLSLGVELLRGGRPRGRLSLQLDVENLADNVYVIAREGEFSAGQFSIPRLISATARVRW